MRISNQIALASMNPGKFREFADLFKKYPEVELIPIEGLLRNPDKLGLVENFSTYAENAAAKARVANQGCHYPVLADDSGLEVTALDGRPGVRSARFAKVPPSKMGASRDAQDAANMELLLSELKGKSDRSAKFVCSLALMVEGLLIQARGELEGTILESPRGTHGFGYDPIFVPTGSSKSLAEIFASEKNAISHRAKAIDQLMLQIHARGIVLAKP